MKLYLLKGYVIINSIDTENTTIDNFINWIKQNKDNGKILAEIDISDNYINNYINAMNAMNK